MIVRPLSLTKGPESPSSPPFPFLSNSATILHATQQQEEDVFLSTSSISRPPPTILSSATEDAFFRQPLSVLTFAIGISIGLSIVAAIAVLKLVSSGEEEPSDNSSNRSLEKGGSRTALLALYARSQAFQCGYGPDQLAPIFLDQLLTSGQAVALQGCGFLSRLNYRLTHRIFEDQVAGLATLGNTGLVAPMQARTGWFDDCVQAFVELQHSNANVVILGSGFDSRCYRLVNHTTSIRTYEVDAPGTQSTKKQVLKDTHMDASRTVFVACDFETEDWFQCLVDSGLEASLPTLVVWEGVTMYLSRATVVETLQRVSHQLSWYIAFDYLDQSWANSGIWRTAMKRVGEPFQFAMNGSNREPEELLQSCGLQVVEHWHSGDTGPLEERYLPVRAGDQPVGFLGNYGGFVLAASATIQP